MSRVKWKGPFVQQSLLTKITNKEIYQKKAVKIYSRKSVILPKFLNITFLIHNGKTFSKIKITEEMLGHKFGEFSPTRKKFTFKNKRRKN